MSRRSILVYATVVGVAIPLLIFAAHGVNVHNQTAANPAVGRINFNSNPPSNVAIATGGCASSAFSGLNDHPVLGEINFGSLTASYVSPASTANVQGDVVSPAFGAIRFNAASGGMPAGNVSIGTAAQSVTSAAGPAIPFNGSAVNAALGTISFVGVDTTWRVNCFDYNLTNSGNITVTQGASGSNTITRTLTTGTAQAVTLSISGLPAGASASFTNNPCNPTCSSTLTITTAAATPAGTYTITVTGSPLSKTTTFSLVVNPPILTASCSVSPTTITSGGSATWTATASGGTGTFTYSWTGTDGLTGTTASVPKVYNTAGTKTASVTVTSGAQNVTVNCSNSLTVNASTGDMQIHRVDSALNVLVTPATTARRDSLPATETTSNPTSLAAGSNFINLTTGNHTAQVSDLQGWQETVATCSYVRGGAACTLPSAASYTTAGMSCDGTWCTYSPAVVNGNEVRKVVFRYELIPITASCSVSPTTITSGGSATWTATASGGTGTFTYSWSGTDGLTGTTASVAKVYNTPGSKTASVTVTSGAQNVTVNCSNSLSVNAVPVANAQISKDNVTFAGIISVTQGVATPVYLSASAAPSSSDPDGWTSANGVSSGGKCDWNSNLNQGAPTYETTINNPASASACNISLGSITFNDAPGTYTYQVLRITDNRGAASNIATVQVQVAAPGLGGSCSVSPTSAITGQTVTWTASATGGVGGYTYSWSGAESLSGTTNPINKVYSTTGAKTASVTITSGAQTITQACSNSVNVGVPTVTGTLSASPSSGTSPLPVTLTAQVTGGTATGNITYEFDCTDNGGYEFTQTTAATSLSYSSCPAYTTSATARVRITRGTAVAQPTAPITINPPAAVGSFTITHNPQPDPHPHAGTSDLSIATDVSNITRLTIVPQGGFNRDVRLRVVNVQKDDNLNGVADEALIGFDSFFYYFDEDEVVSGTYSRNVSYLSPNNTIDFGVILRSAGNGRYMITLEGEAVGAGASQTAQAVLLLVVGRDTPGYIER